MAKRTLNFGQLTIEFDAPGRTPFGVPIEPDLLKRENVFVTLCPIKYRLEGVGELDVEQDFIFDGMSDPREAWVIPGFAPCGDHLWAVCGHDKLCVLANAGLIDRVIADAWFDAILERTGVEVKRRTIFELAVNIYRWFRRYLAWRASR